MTYALYTFYLFSEGCFWSSMHDTRGWGSDMQDDDTHGSVSRVYETVLIIIYTHIYLSLSLPTTHKIHLKLLIFHSQGTRCQEDECRNRERERATYVWCDHLLRAACAHLNTPFSHWTNEADGSTVACQENYTIITGFSNISSPHAAPSLALSLSQRLSHITQYPGLLWHVKCTPPCFIRPFQAMQYRILFS